MPKVGGNRDRNTEPVRVRTWCGGCDAALVPDGTKCPVCGHRKKTKRRRKD